MGYILQKKKRFLASLGMTKSFSRRVWVYLNRKCSSCPDRTHFEKVGCGDATSAAGKSGTMATQRPNYGEVIST